MDHPIYELKISENIDDNAEVSTVAFVDFPAIKRDFLQFAEGVPHYTADGKLWTGATHKDSNGKLMTGAVHSQESEYLYHEGEYAAETYTDYPEQAAENAKIALRYAEEYGWGECGTPVGKARANQLANKEAISRETIARMSSFVRQRQNSNKELGDGCGRLMWLAWGGDAGIEWAQKKLQQIDKTNLIQNFAIQNEDKRIVTGALMIPNQLIYRKSEKFGEHYVKFSADTIKDIAIKFAKKGFQKNVNLMHDEELSVEGVTMFESFLSDKGRGISPIAAFADLPDGSWFGSFYVENDKVWQLVKDNQLRGFSVEGMFDYVQPKQSDEAKLMELKNIFGQF